MAPPTEQALLDLERAHEESGAQQWQALTEVIACLRREVAEAKAGVAESHRSEADLAERFVKERSANSNSLSALRSELTALSARLDSDLESVQKKAKASLESHAADFRTRLVTVDARVEKQHERLGEQSQVHQTAAVSHVSRIEQLEKQLEALRESADKDRQTAVERVAEVASTTERLQSSLQTERSQRLVFQRRSEEADADLGVSITEERAHGDSETDRLRVAVEELRRAHSVQRAEHTESYQRAISQIHALDQKLDRTFATCEASFTDRLAKLGETAGSLTANLAKEVSAREASDKRESDHFTAIDARLEKSDKLREEGERRAKEDNMEALRALQAEKTSRETADARLDREIQSLSSVVEANNKGHTNQIADVRKLLEALRAELKIETEERTAGDRLLQAELVQASQVEAVAREKLGERLAEMPVWVQVAVDGALNHARDHHNITSNEIRRQVDITAGTLGRLENSHGSMNETLIRWEALHGEHKEKLDGVDGQLQEISAVHQGTAAEHRHNMNLHREQLEVLTKDKESIEMRLEYDKESMEKHCLHLLARLTRMEEDMKRLRGHLPLCFVSSAAFGLTSEPRSVASTCR